MRHERWMHNGQREREKNKRNGTGKNRSVKVMGEEVLLWKECCPALQMQYYVSQWLHGRGCTIYLIELNQQSKR